MILQCNHAKIKSKSRNVEQLQRFSRKSEKIRANFMKISENYDKIWETSNFLAFLMLKTPKNRRKFAKILRSERCKSM